MLTEHQPEESDKYFTDFPLVLFSQNDRKYLGNKFRLGFGPLKTLEVFHHTSL